MKKFLFWFAVAVCALFCVWFAWSVWDVIRWNVIDSTNISPLNFFKLFTI